MGLDSTQSSVSKFLQYDCGVKIVTYIHSPKIQKSVQKIKGYGIRCKIYKMDKYILNYCR